VDMIAARNNFLRGRCVSCGEPKTLNLPGDDRQLWWATVTCGRDECEDALRAVVKPAA
jgi:hypothetical protein